MRAVLIANRGEIAVRVARACTDAGLRSIAVFADDDAGALHVRRADEAHALGGVGVRPYLDVESHLRVAREAGADAVHPGYGFLSEDAGFAQRVLDAGLTWVGPPPAAMRALGDKVSARRIAQEVGTPMVAGTTEPLAGAEEVHAFAAEHGYPVAIKAAFGGGGRGLKVVRGPAEVEEMLAAAVREAVTAFGRGECFLERYLEDPRHVEVQVLADTHGRVVVVGTRDCSLQRRHQKLVEEAPAPFLTVEQEVALWEGARAICARAGYVGAGTVEFLLGADGTLSFLEVNTRLQVEHPVTEETAGVDLVRAQLAIAAGAPSPLSEDPPARGHAIEFRLNAEDAGRGFLPATGTVTDLVVPGGPGVRMDSGVEIGSVVGAAFDSLLAKLVVTGADREEALRRARRALGELVIDGVATVLPFHRAVLEDPAFTAADGRFGVHTRWIETELADRLAPSPHFADDVDDTRATGLRRVVVTVDGRRVELGLPSGLLTALAGAGGALGGPQEPDSAPGEAEVDEAVLRAPVFGSVVAWHAAEGAHLQAGDAVLTLEAMKMEVPVTAHRPGRLGPPLAEVGSTIRVDQALARIEQ